jgi:modulator of FtsH protease HflC
MRILLAPVLLILAFLGLNSLYSVRQDELALLLRLGQIEKTSVPPGLHFKLPFVNNVRRFSARLLSLENPQERYLTGEKKHVLVDSVVKWKITDAGLFYKAFAQVGADTSAANSRISQIVKDRLRDEFNKRALRDLVASARQDMMDQIVLTSGGALKPFGIEVVDVRIKRIELPDEVSESVFQRMQSERKQVADGLRANGRKQAEQLRAEAEKLANVVIADAERQSQIMRGEGDAKAAEIYAKAYNSDPDFYAFYRSLESYRKSFASGQGNVLVLDPNSEFFKYFDNSKYANPR